MLNWRIGTVGFGYGDWSGVFYPVSMKPADYLEYYASHFDALELDTTFHGTPPAGRVRRWGDVVPQGFQFCVKAPKAVTHDVPPQRAVTPLRQFLATMAELGPKLAVVLLQYPPSFSPSHLPAWRAFVKEVTTAAEADAPGVRFAVEFRDDAWRVPEVAGPLESTLREHRWARVSADLDHAPALVDPLADFTYVRWIGEHGRFAYLGEEERDASERLTWWKQQIEAQAAGESPPIRTAWGFFNNDYTGYAVGTANRFKAMLGQPVRHGGDGQGQLFG